MSTGSDEYEEDEDISHPGGRQRGVYQQRLRKPPATSSLSSRVGQITKSLQDTNRNINAVDGLLGDYKDINQTQAKAVERLRDNLATSTEQLREERGRNQGYASSRDQESRTLHASDLEAGGDRHSRYNPTSPLREYRVSGGAGSRMSKRPTGVRFDESGPEVHDLHQAVRDLSSEQLRMGSELNREVERRNKMEQDKSRKYNELSESTGEDKKPAPHGQPADRVELRLREIQDELRQQRLEQEAKGRYEWDRVKESRDQQHLLREKEALEKERTDVLSEVKKMVSSQRRDEEKILREHLLQSESEKARLVSELRSSKRELEHSKDSKSALEQKMVSSQRRDEEKILREHLLQSESENARLVSELRSSKRELEHSKDSKSALEQKIDKLSHDFHHSRDEQRSLQGRLVQYQEALEEGGIPKQQRREQRIRAPLLTSSVPEMDVVDAQKQQELERAKVEREIESLRQQLAEVTRLRDGDDLKSQIHKTEQQRDQMVQHLNRLKKELEDKDRQQGTLLQDLQDVTENLDVSERERKRALSQLEELQERLRDTSSASEMESLKAKDQSRQLEESHQKRTELKAKAQNIIRQWKAKCKRLERELDLRQQDSSQCSDRLGSILRENDNLKTQAGNLTHRMESLQKEMQDILERRAEQDEQLRLRDIQVRELKAARTNLDQELRDARGFMDKAEAELRDQQARLVPLEDDLMEQKQSASRLKSANDKLSQENKLLHEQVKRYDAKQSEQLKVYTHEVSQKRDLEQRLGQAEAEGRAMKEEVEKLAAELNQEQEAYLEEITRYREEQQKNKEREERDIQDLTRKIKRERVETEAEIQTLKIEVSEHKSTSKSVRKQLDRSKADYDQRRDDLSKLEADNMKLRRKYDRMKANYEDQLQLNDVGDNRASHLQNRVHILQETCEKQLTDYESCLRGISKEIDALLAVLCQETSEETLSLSKSPTKSQLECHPDRWLAELKTKLQWAKEEVRNLIIKKKKLRMNLNRSRSEAEELLQNHVHEKSMIEDEFEKQEDVLHQLAASRKDLEIENLEKTQELTSLQRQVASLEAHIEKGADMMGMSQFPGPTSLDGPSLTEDLDKLQELQNEKERINERYLKYQGTLTLLQKQLEEAKQLTSS